jgi:hypothetical protein
MSLRVSDKAIQKEVDKFIDIWVLGKKYPRPISKEYITVPLYNVGCKKKAVFSSKSGHLVSLCHFTDRRKNQIWNAFDDTAEDMGVMTVHGISKSKVFLTIKSRDKSCYDSYIQCALSALRLSSTGHIFTPGVIGTYIPSNCDKGYHGSLDGFLPPPHIRYTQRNASELNKINAGSYIELSDVVLLKARKLFLIMSSDHMKLWNKFRVAISRFNKTFSRTNLEDIVIDLSIALEGVLLEDSGGKDISYKLRIRGTRLLSCIEESRDVYHFLKHFYNIRSTIVHNGSTFEDKEVMSELSKLRKISSQDFVERARTITRDIIIAALERRALPKDLRTKLDDEIAHLSS